MLREIIKYLIHNKYILLFISAIGIILSFPKFNMFILAWFSFVPWFIFLLNEKKSIKVLYISLIFGFVVNSGIFYWLIPTFVVAGVNIIFALILFLILNFYLSLYFGLFGFLVNKIRERLNVFYLATISASLWVVLELLRNYLLTGFPWALLGYSQWNNRIMIQIAEFTGVYGISFLIVLVNFYFAFLIISLLTNLSFDSFTVQASEVRQSQYNKSLNILKYFILIIILTTSMYGYNVLKKVSDNNNKTIKYSILQGNIDQYKKFDNAYLEFIKGRYSFLLDITREKKSDIVIWSETSFPGIYPQDLTTRLWLKDQIINTNTHNLVGAIVKDNDNYYNGGILFNKTGREINRYYKKHLVLFGETFPFKEVIAKYVAFADTLGGIEKGEKEGIFSINDIKYGVGICFEVLFPNEFRRHKLNNVGFVANITNDGWYLLTAAPYQHLSFCVFRAVENRCPILRAANTGISAHIDENGRIVKSLGLNEAGVLTGSVKPKYKRTFYSKYGDVFVYFCIVYCLVLFLFRILLFGRKVLQ